jgi:chemosensory pili system protein ChpA (sensor histidine kinase/response regulator)
MQPEQQQRILGYFLEEAREHLNTIEQGLLNLQSTLNDSEMINEVFRAAHSIKGGAAMLGLSSIQHTSHQLEDCFKILKEHPIQVDQRLESLLLDICDTLKALVDNLGNPFGLSEEKAQALMSKTEPVMQWLNKHIEILLKQGDSGVISFNNSSLTRLQLDTPVPIQVQKLSVTTKQNQDWTEFQTQVLQILRKMLQQFKQTNLGNSRENLQECCHQLAKIGKDLNLSNWCSLCESAALAISNPNNSYLTLAKIIITEIKQAQELVFQNRDAEIAISQQLETLFPLPQRSLLELEETPTGETLFTEPTELNLDSVASVNITNTTEFTDQLLFNHHQSIFTHNFSEIGISELNTLADLFEGDTPDLDDTWQQEEILEDITNYQLPITSSEVENNYHDLADLLFFEEDDNYAATTNDQEDLTLFFDEILLETENISLSNLQSETVNSQPIESSNLFFDAFLSKAEDAKNKVNKDANSTAEIIPTTVKISKTKPSAPENLSLDDLFAEMEKNTPLLINETNDLFGTLEITTNFSNSVNNLDNFWDDLNTTNSESTASGNQDVAKELEESLFSASVEIGAKNQQSTTSNSLNKKEFDLIFEEQEESFDLLFTSDTDNEAQAINNLFDVVVEANSSSSTVPIVESRELFLPEINNFPQSPEELNSIPEFTYQPSETTTNIQLVEILEYSNNHNLILLEEEITSSASDVSENLITNTDRNDLAIFAEAESNLNFTSNFADFNLELESNSTTTELAADVFVVGETSPELELENLVEISLMDEFAEIEAFLAAASGEITNEESIQDEDFAALEALLGENEDDKLQIFSLPPAIIQPAVVKSQNTFSELGLEDEFSELENLLKQADKTISSSSATSQKTSNSKIPRPITRRTIREESMKIPVKQLDDMSNLVGELVINRNTLEQDHERLRQSLDSLLVQVQHLSDVGVRMQQYYERSLLEASLLSSRRFRESDNSSGHSHNRGFSEIEMDRFTPFHSLAQEMIEFIVRVRESASDIDFVTEETEQVARQLRQATSQLQEGLTKARMVPFTQAIDRLRRGVRDNAIRYGKQVELVTEGVDTLVDKMILDHLTDPLTHMVNNAIAHGIETPEVRQAAGKSPIGTINIRALQQGNQTIISVSDDGAGIDHEKVKNKAVKKGILTPEQAKIISRIETYELLFLPSFSTADEVDDIKGRGVGMNVVHNDISEIRGTVGTDSKLGKGTTFTIRLPLTLSICKALFCICDRTRIAFPMDGVEDTLNIPAKNVQKDADGESFIVWRETILPFKPLKEILVFNRQLSRGNVYGTKTDDDMISVIIVRSGNTMIALEIDQVLSEQEIVIKQFEGPAPKPSGVAGATVLGDGMIMPIADVLEIIDIFQGKMSKHIGGNWQRLGLLSIDVISAEKVEKTVLIVDDSITVRELLSLTFTKAGYRVEQARDGQEAWDKLRSGLPCDIVFCDIEMPRCDGLEFLSRIQKDGSFGHLPIAMLTSRGADKHRQMALQLGASGYFTKPYLEEALLEAASRMLKGENLVPTT